jgi:hypothetical protein
VTTLLAFYFPPPPPPPLVKGAKRAFFVHFTYLCDFLHDFLFKMLVSIDKLFLFQQHVLKIIFLLSEKNNTTVR